MEGVPGGDKELEDCVKCEWGLGWGWGYASAK